MNAQDDPRYQEKVKEWEAIGLRTGPSDREAAETAVRDAYRMAGEKVPDHIVWVESPWQGLNRAAIERFDLTGCVAGTPTTTRSEPTDDERRSALGDVAYGQPDAPWLCRADQILSFEPDNPDFKDALRIEPTLRLAKEVSWWWPYDDVVVLLGHPSVLDHDAAGDLHGETGPAVAWPTGDALFFWHGTPIPVTAVEDPDNYPIQDVINEQNQEVRRVLIECLGWERLLTGMRATVVQSDIAGELITCGVRLPEAEGEVVTLVRVTNSTPEGYWEPAPGGTWFDVKGVPLNPEDPSDAALVLDHQLDLTGDRLPLRHTPNKRFVTVEGPHGEPAPYFKQYILRVPQETKTALDGVAWTFNKTAAEYEELLLSGHQS